jgi:hypothetical protein
VSTTEDEPDADGQTHGSASPEVAPAARASGSPHEEGEGPGDDVPLSAREAEDEMLKAALARGMSYREAGDVAGVSERTVARRMESETFQRAVGAVRSEYLTVVTGQLMSAGAEALVVLRAGLHDELRSERRLAAKEILRLGIAYRHHGDLETEVAALRAELRAGKDKKGRKS